MKQKVQMKSLQEKLSKQFHTKSVVVDNAMNDGLVQLMNMYEKDATKGKSDESFHKIFWAQQLKALSMKSKYQI